MMQTTSRERLTTVLRCCQSGLVLGQPGNSVIAATVMLRTFVILETSSNAGDECLRRPVHKRHRTRAVLAAFFFVLVARVGSKIVG